MKYLCDENELNKNIKYLEKLKEEYKERIGVIEVRNIEEILYYCKVYRLI